MRAAMIALALACLLIGSWPQAMVQLIFNGLRHLGPLAAVQPEVLGAIPSHLALASRLFLGLLLAVFLLQRLLYRGKPVEHSGTWGCGFTRPTARIQYTGASYAMSLVEFFRPFLWQRKTAQALAAARVCRTAALEPRDQLRVAILLEGENPLPELGEVWLHELLDGPHRARTRQMTEIPGLGYAANRVLPDGQAAWTVLLDMQLMEAFRGQPVKDAFIRYPIRVVRYDVDRERNPWRLAIDCYGSHRPERLDVRDVQDASSGKTEASLPSVVTPPALPRTTGDAVDPHAVPTATPLQHSAASAQ